MDLLAELQWRGMVHATTEGLAAVLQREKVTAYIGFDPTAASLHVGSLLTVMGLARLQRFGHRPIALVGGGTGLIGDPSGKSQERNLLTFEHVDENARGIRRQLERFLDFAPGVSNGALLRNNVEWLRSIGLLDFLRDIGKHFTISYMMSKESVKRRLEGADGISFTEFSYQLLQAYDYLVLHDRDRCTLQMGGTDQWGNITAGCDLIRKMRATRVHGLVWPLLTTSSGAKFGKTELGTVWLDAGMTSPFRFYQFWLKADDRDVVQYLKYFTWLEPPAIEALERATVEAPERREAQRTLAREVTALVHGRDEVARAERAALVLYGGEVSGLSAADLLAVFDDVPTGWIAAGRLTAGLPATELVVLSGLAGSKAEAGRLIKQGGITVNGRRLGDERGRLTLEDALDRELFVIRKGRRQTHVVRIGVPPGC